MHFPWSRFNTIFSTHTSARLKVLDFNFHVRNFNLLQPELLLELAQPVPVVGVVLGQDGDLSLHPGQLLLLLCVLLELEKENFVILFFIYQVFSYHSLVLMVLRHAMDVKATSLTANRFINRLCCS